jgi:hypothetical protein
MICCLDLGEVDLARIVQACIARRLAGVDLPASSGDAELLDGDHARRRRWEQCDGCDR